MIKIEFSLFLGLYVGGWLFFFFLVWLKEKLSFRLERFSMKKKFLRECSVCTYTYFLSFDYPLSRCPLCGSLNKTSSKDKAKEE